MDGGSRIAYVDIETTGLNPERNQILSVGIVVDDFVSEVSSLPSMEIKLWHEELIGHPRALAMNAQLIGSMENNWTPVTAVSGLIANFLYNCCPEVVTFGGKNFGGFDLQFLKRLPGWRIRHRHRYMDCGPLFFDPRVDETLPDLSLCMKRAGVSGNVSHTALSDVYNVLECVRAYYEI